MNRRATTLDVAFDVAHEVQAGHGPAVQFVAGTWFGALLLVPGMYAIVILVQEHLFTGGARPVGEGINGFLFMVALFGALLFVGLLQAARRIRLVKNKVVVADAQAVTKHRLSVLVLFLVATSVQAFLVTRIPHVCVLLFAAMVLLPWPVHRRTG